MTILQKSKEDELRHEKKIFFDFSAVGIDNQQDKDGSLIVYVLSVTILQKSKEDE